MHIWRHIENCGNHYLIVESDFDFIPKVNKLFYDSDLGRFPSVNGVNYIDIQRHMLQFKISSMFLDRLQEIKESIETKLGIPSSDTTYGFYSSDLEKILIQEPQIASKDERVDLPTMTEEDKKLYQENIRKIKIINETKRRKND